MGGRRDPDGYTSALPYGEIARQLPHRNATSLAARARKLELITYARRWSIHDDQRLLQLTVRGSTLEDVARRLGADPEAIRQHASRLGINPPEPAPAPRHARRWTDEEEALLRLHHALNPGHLAELLGRSDAAVCRRLCALGLRARAQRSPHHSGNGRAASAATTRAGQPSGSAIGPGAGPIRADRRRKAVAAGAGTIRMYGSGPLPAVRIALPGRFVGHEGREDRIPPGGNCGGITA